MGDKNTKELRGQIRQIVKELLPEIMGSELIAAIDKKLSENVKKIEGQVKETMHEMNERHKSTMSYLVREVTVVKPQEIKDK